MNINTNKNVSAFVSTHSSHIYNKNSNTETEENKIEKVSKNIFNNEFEDLPSKRNRRNAINATHVNPSSASKSQLTNQGSDLLGINQNSVENRNKIKEILGIKKPNEELKANSDNTEEKSEESKNGTNKPARPRANAGFQDITSRVFKTKRLPQQPLPLILSFPPPNKILENGEIPHETEVNPDSAESKKPEEGKGPGLDRLHRETFETLSAQEVEEPDVPVLDRLRTESLSNTPDEISKQATDSLNVDQVIELINKNKETCPPKKGGTATAPTIYRVSDSSSGQRDHSIFKSAKEEERSIKRSLEITGKKIIGQSRPTELLPGGKSEAKFFGEILSYEVSKSVAKIKNELFHGNVEPLVPITYPVKQNKGTKELTNIKSTEENNENFTVGSLQIFVKNHVHAKAAKTKIKSDPEEANENKEKSEKQIQDFQFFAIESFLCGNLDAHLENFLLEIDKEGYISHIGAIDNGNSFPANLPSEKDTIMLKNVNAWGDFLFKNELFTEKSIQLCKQLKKEEGRLRKTINTTKQELQGFVLNKKVKITQIFTLAKK